MVPNAADIDTARLRPAVRNRPRLIRSRRICVEPGCGATFTTTDLGIHRCPPHEAAHAAADNQRRHQKQRDHGRDTARWAELRETALHRDGHVCQLQHTGCTERATTVHLDPALDGDHLAATPDDLTSACAHCHGVADGARSRGGRAETETTIRPVVRQFSAGRRMREQADDAAWVA